MSVVVYSNFTRTVVNICKQYLKNNTSYRAKKQSSFNMHGKLRYQCNVFNSYRLLSYNIRIIFKFPHFNMTFVRLLRPSLWEVCAIFPGRALLNCTSIM